MAEASSSKLFYSQKIVFVSLAVLLGVSMALQLYFSQLQNNALYHSKVDQLKSSIADSFQLSINGMQKRYSLMAQHYGHMPVIPEAMQSYNRQALYDLTQKDYQMMRDKDPNLFVMHFIDPKNVTILRMHKPQSFGDDLTDIRPIVSFVNRKQIMISGFEPGKNGITYRITNPIFNEDNEYFGVLEFGIEPTYFVDFLKNNYGIEAQILVKTNQLKNLTYQTNYRKVENYSVVYEDGLFQKISNEISNSGSLIYYQDRVFVEIPDITLETFDGKPIARIRVLKDITEFERQHRNQYIVQILISIVLFLISIFVIYWILNSYQKRIIRILGALKRTKEKNHRIEMNSIRDDLTNLYNRRYFNQVFQRLLESERDGLDCILVFFDIDFFKTINDEHGHVIGDQILKSLSGFVKSRLREEDQVFRWGGEEFAILLMNTHLNAAVDKMDTLRQEVGQTVWHNQIRFTISIGVTVISEQDRDLDKLVERVDELLYLAKSSGRDCLKHD